MQRWGLPLLTCGTEHPLPGLSGPVPGHCYLNGSWLAIWTGKCAKGWHKRGWTVGAPLFHTVERNITGKKVIRVGDRESNMSAHTCIHKKKTSGLHVYLRLMWNLDVMNAPGNQAVVSQCFYCLFGVWRMTFDTMTSLANWQIVMGKRNKWFWCSMVDMVFVGISERY